MGTKETLSKLSDNARRTLAIYKLVMQENERETENYKGRIKGYLAALEDANIITQAELRLLYTYYTLD